MRCPFAQWRPISNNLGPNMSAHIGLVLHVQVGNGSLWGYFNNPATQASSHFWVSKTGLVEQYVDTNLRAWAEAAGNPEYLSVETEGYPTDPLTTDQINAVAALLAWSADLYSFPIAGPVPHGSPGFTPHCNPDGTPDPAWGNHSCPGLLRLDQMNEIIAVATAPPPKGSSEMLIASTPTGKGYYAAKPDGSVFAFGDAKYSGGVNNAGPGGTSALPAGDTITGLAAVPGIAGAYWLISEKGQVYAFGGAPYFGNVP